MFWDGVDEILRAKKQSRAKQLEPPVPEGFPPGAILAGSEARGAAGHHSTVRVFEEDVRESAVHKNGMFFFAVVLIFAFPFAPLFFAHSAVFGLIAASTLLRPEVDKSLKHFLDVPGRRFKKNVRYAQF